MPPRHHVRGSNRRRLHAWVRVDEAGNVVESQGVAGTSRPVTGRLQIDLSKNRAVDRRHVTPVVLGPNGAFVSENAGLGDASTVVVDTRDAGNVLVNLPLKVEITRVR